MAFDVYKQCPCGSGKKLKFCCASIADEMAKATRLQDNHQGRLALQIAEKIQHEHPDRPWPYVLRATILLDENNIATAKSILHDLLQREPDHPFATGLFAMSSLAVDGLDNAKIPIYRALQRCTPVLPQLVSSLATTVSSILLNRGRFLAAREYLALAMRTADEQVRERLFVTLLQFDGDQNIYYPLRSVHQIVEYTGSEDATKQARQAQRVAGIGCFEPAARLYARLAEQDPQSAALSQNVGFCRAWDGDEAGALDPLRRASKLQSDRFTAVELETIAQLLELSNATDLVKSERWTYKVNSVSRLLTSLDGSDRLQREVIDPGSEQDEWEIFPAGLFDVLDRSIPTTVPQSPDEIPKAIASIAVFDANPEKDEPARAVLMALEGEQIERARQLFEQLAGSDVEAATLSEPSDDLPQPAIPRELLALQWRWADVPGLSTQAMQRLHDVQWKRILEDVWPNNPRPALGGKTPREAASDPDLRTALDASVLLLDALCEKDRFTLDVNEVYKRLGIPPLEPVPVDKDTQLNSFSALRLIHVPVAAMTDTQLLYALNRAYLIQHTQFLYAVLTEILSRPECASKINLDRAYSTLLAICRQRGLREESLQWLEKGRQREVAEAEAFEHRLQWDIREVLARLDNPEDEKLQALLLKFRDYYFPKLPDLRQQIDATVRAAGVAVPWGDEVESPAFESPVGSTTASGLWTPESAAPSAPAGGKLWLPGS